MWQSLWSDEHGAIISPEIALIGALLLIGVIVGISTLAVSISFEIRDIAEAVQSVDWTPGP